MDFVVIGLGLSALALLTGLTLLCLVAPRWFRKAGAVHPGDAAYARAQAEERQALGQGFLCVGAVLLLATLGGISAELADKAGAYLIASVTTVAALGLFGWDVLYRRQHPMPPRRRAAPLSVKPADEEATSLLPAAMTTLVRRRVLPARHRVMPAATALATSSAIPAADSTAAGDERPRAVVLEPVGETTITQPSGGDAAFAPGGQTPAVDATAIPEADLGELEEPVSHSTEAGAPDAIAPVLAEPVQLPTKSDNGTVKIAVGPAPEAEPDLASHGDDRVIALFPTAAARRSRSVTAPMDPDGQS